MTIASDFEPLIEGSLFDTGRLYATPAAKAAMQAHGLDSLAILRRYVTGDWSDLDEEYIENNRQAVRTGGFITVQYRLDGNDMINVCTRADRYCTLFDIWELSEEDDE